MQRILMVRSVDRRDVPRATSPSGLLSRVRKFSCHAWCRERAGWWGPSGETNSAFYGPDRAKFLGTCLAHEGLVPISAAVSHWHRCAAHAADCICGLLLQGPCLTASPPPTLMASLPVSLRAVVEPHVPFHT